MAYDKTAFLGRIGVLMGGPSSEREISIKSGKAVFAALQEKHCDAVPIVLDSTDEHVLVSRLKDEAVDIVFIALHGAFGEDGTVQKILEGQHIPYTGSGSEASRVAMNKISTLERLKTTDVLSPGHVVVSSGEHVDFQELVEKLGGSPLVVKPASQGSSLGISIVPSGDVFQEALRHAFALDQEVLVERYIQGKEITAGILGDEALPLVEIRPRCPFFDFQAKYQTGMSAYIVPAEISSSATQRVQGLACKAFQTLGCRDFARLDFILDREDNPFFLEANTIPGFTATSLLPMAAREAGYEFGQLCLRILTLAQEREKITSSTLR
ncbi:MAG TPA: D-alanine--D-alanine ligase [Candidatus Omnitrophota bacterium]|nr:D-alanine--D-alanine ligase [Candidatus Omnitrophota bacterium]HPN55403.1 D-alanine--D-alanine ligase [Candidatus Omnitrophota bacterium]